MTIASWIASKQEILRVAQEHAINTVEALRLKDVRGCSSCSSITIKRALQDIGLASENITVGHCTARAERAIVLFSPVYDMNHSGTYFFDQRLQ
jgi:hypothetical protein